MNPASVRSTAESQEDSESNAETTIRDPRITAVALNAAAQTARSETPFASGAGAKQSFQLAFARRRMATISRQTAFRRMPDFLLWHLHSHTQRGELSMRRNSQVHDRTRG